MPDAASVQKLAGDREIADTTLRIPYPYEDGMAQEWISTHSALREQEKEIIFAIVLKDDDELVGSISLSIDRPNESAELGYWIGKPFWNNGFASEAARAILAYGFGELNLNRIHAHHFKRNPASGRVLQKAGMKHEGCLRQHVKKRNAFEDIVVYGLLREEYSGGR